jgi:hypothetical protein
MICLWSIETMTSGADERGLLLPSRQTNLHLEKLLIDTEGQSPAPETSLLLPLY